VLVFVFQHKNSLPPEINHLSLPPPSPDLNRIKCTGDMLGSPIVWSARDVRTVLPNLWDNLDQGTIGNLILSMSRRLVYLGITKGNNRTFELALINTNIFR
jgi:hypothetical protein